jgi:hypothetical protein
MDFHHRTNYGQNEPVNIAILIFNEYCDLIGFRDEEGRYVYRSGFSRALSGERSHFLMVLDVPSEVISISIIQNGQ